MYCENQVASHLLVYHHNQIDDKGLLKYIRTFDDVCCILDNGHMIKINDTQYETVERVFYYMDKPERISN